MMKSMMGLTIKKLADLAGVSVRTLHYYDEIGLLKPVSRSASGYRYYNQDSVVRLQQIMFFRELDFGLDEIREIISRPDFDVLEALQAHQTLLKKKAVRINRLLSTVEKTIKKLKGEAEMQIKDYYAGFSDERSKNTDRRCGGAGVKKRWKRVKNGY
jgi:MerR family transcriptional regulator, thiopeptide resistance regulator